MLKEVESLQYTMIEFKSMDSAKSAASSFVGVLLTQLYRVCLHNRRVELTLVVVYQPP